MKVISDTTLVTRSNEGRVDHAPGAPVDLPVDDAKDLIARGIARAADGSPLPPADDSEKEAIGTGEPLEEVAGSELDNRINLNTAQASELTTIKGVGKKTAGDIVASREADGPFESLADCADRVGGVSLEQLETADVTV